VVTPLFTGAPPSPGVTHAQLEESMVATYYRFLSVGCHNHPVPNLGHAPPLGDCTHTGATSA